MQKRLMLFRNRQQDTPLIKKKYTNLSGGHWITVTKEGSLHGKHLYIDDNGTILAGKVPKEFHGKKLSELHHMDVPHDKKADEVVKRPIPDQAPYLSKKPIHNTYSKKTPSELKAIIAQAKANIKANGGNGYDKKVIAVASYYLNGGQKPDDSAFGPKGKNKETEETSPKEAPHTDKEGLHDMFSGMSKDELKAAVPQLQEKLKSQQAFGFMGSLTQKKLDIVDYYLNGGQKPDLASKEAEEKTPEKQEEKPTKEQLMQQVKDSAPHKDLIGAHNHYAEKNAGQLEEAQAMHINDLRQQIAVGDGVSNTDKKILDIINHYLVAKGGEAKEAPTKEEAPKYSGPHQDKSGFHQYYHHLDKEQLETKQEKQLKALANPTGIDVVDDSQKKALDVINHYLEQKGGTAKEFDPKEHAPHQGKYPLTHKAVEDGDKLKIKGKQADLTSQMHTYISNENKEYYDTAKEKLEIANYYATHHGASKVEAPDYESSVVENQKKKQTIQDEAEKKKQTLLDDFHNPSHVIQTEDHEHHGKEIKDFGIDYKNSDHVHAWHKKIDHDAKGNSASELESRAYKMTELIKEGDHATGKTNGNDVTAKQKVEKNLGLALAHHDDFLKLARRVGSSYGLPSDNANLTLEQRQKLSRSAVDNIVRKWAHTSADHDPLAIAVQLASMEEFGLEATSNTFSEEAKKAAHENYLSHPEIKSGLKAFLREQYNQTQDWFKAQGITHVPIMRGMGMKNEKALSHIPLNTPTKTKFGLQPISSFSSSADTAKSFTDMSSTGSGGPYKVIVGAMIPVERILGCPQTGYGCMGEKELIVLGGGKELDNVVAYRWNNGSKGNFHQSDMFKFMEQLSGSEVSTQEPGKKAPKAPPQTKKATTEYHVKTTFGYKPAVNAKQVVNDHGFDLFVHKTGGGYKVNEGSTGLGVTATYKTQKAAISTIHSKLANPDSLEHLKTQIANTPKHADQMMTKSLIKSVGGILYPDADIENADWTKTSWDLPPYGSPEFNGWLKSTSTDLEHFKKTPVYQHMIQKQRMKKSEEDDRGYHQSARYAYKTHARDPIYLPVNRIKTPYQTEEATNEDKVAENVQRIKNGDAMHPVIIGYDYDLHDGHHRLEAAKRVGHTHVPCVVGGRNERRVEAARKRYKGIWKSAAIVEGKLLVKSDNKDLPEGGKWVTTHGSHIYIKDGKVLAGAENGLHMSYVRIHNTGKSKTKHFGNEYAQDIEPHGEYMSHDSMNGKSRIDQSNYEYGKIHFKNPLFIEHETTGHDGWKTKLSEQFGGKKGKALSNVIKKKGHDGIVTLDSKYGEINETVNLSGEKSSHDEVKKSIAIVNGRLLVKKAEPVKSGERWVTIKGSKVLINGHGDVIYGPEKLKTHVTSKKKSTQPPEAWESKKLTPYDTKEIVDARENARKQVPTHARSYYNSPERKELRKQIAKEMYGTGAVNKNRRVDIVMGPPAAGKSTVFADPLAKEHGSLIIDSDMAKERLPEFDGGNGAGIVHEESAQIIEGLGGVFHKALKNGDNIVLPIVGRGTNKIVQLRDALKQAGYEVHLHLNELPKEKATQRAVARFYSHGRFVDPDYVHNVVGDRPSQVYENLKKIGGFHSYEKYSNDVEKGQKPKVIERLNHKDEQLEKSYRHGDRGSSSRNVELLSGERGSGRGSGLVKSFINKTGRLLLRK